MKIGDPQGKCRSCGEELPPYAGGPIRKFCAKARCNKNSRFRVVSIRSSMVKRRWTNTGEGAVKNLIGEGGDWFCQVCGKVMPEELPAFKFNMSNEVFKLCGQCYFQANINKVNSFFELIDKVRNL